MDRHPSLQELKAFLGGELQGPRARVVVRHLLGGCERCLTGAPELAGYSSPGSAEDEYNAALDRALRNAKQATRGQRQVARRAERLHESLSEIDFEALQATPAGSGGLPLIEALLHKSWELRHTNPRAMVQWAALAVAEADLLSEEEHGAERVLDTRGRAWAELGNAHRVADQLDEAFYCLRRAKELLTEGSGDQWLAVRLVDYQASLAADSRNFSLAQAALTFVYRFHRRHGDLHLAGRALVKKGLYTGYAGELKAAVSLLRSGLALVDQDQEPGLVTAAVHNLLLFLVELKDFREARKLLFNYRPILWEDGVRINRIKLRGIEALAEAALGNLPAAERLFRGVRADFQEEGLTYQAAIISLELAAVLLSKGEAEEARELSLEAVGTFEALGIDREKYKAVLLLRTALESRAAAYTLEKILTDVREFFRRVERDPNAKFEPRVL